MHLLEVLDGFIVVRAIVVQAQEVRRLAFNTAHEICDPCLALGIARTRWTDKLVALLLPKRNDLLEPEICGFLGGDASDFGFVEVENDAVFGVFDTFPVVTGELGHVVDHGTEGSTAFELRGCPGVPVAYGFQRTFECDFVHFCWDALVTGAVGVGPVPEETSLLDDHG